MCILAMLPRPYRDYFVKDESSRKTRLSCRNNLVIPSVHTEMGHKAFPYYGLNFWNRLSFEIKEIGKLSSLKSTLDKHSHILNNHPT